jgi:hypothetical protein
VVEFFNLNQPLPMLITPPICAKFKVKENVFRSGFPAFRVGTILLSILPRVLPRRRALRLRRGSFLIDTFYSAVFFFLKKELQIVYVPRHALQALASAPPEFSRVVTIIYQNSRRSILAPEYLTHKDQLELPGCRLD